LEIQLPGKGLMLPRRKRQLGADQLFEYAVRALGSRAHSIGELREKLVRNAGDPADVDRVLSRHKQNGYLNDRKFADMVATTRLENQGFGRARVLQELRKRRVAPTVAEQAVTSAFEGKDELALIEAFLRRKFRNVDLGAHLQDEKRLASAYRKLRIAGFSSSNTIRVLKRFAAEAGRLEDLEGSEESGAADPSRGDDL
jgi:regulatory protein